MDNPPDGAGVIESVLSPSLRKYLKLTGDKLSRLLHVDKTTLSKWENNDDPVGTQSDLAIRLIVISLDKGLKKKLSEIVGEQFEKIQFGRSTTNNRNKKYAPQRATIQVDASDLSYAYA